MEAFEQDESKRREMKPKSVVFGLLVLLFGVLLLFRNTGLLNDSFFHVVFSWEMLLIAIGLINIFDRNRPLGVVLIVIGSIFILPRIFEFPFAFHQVLWPLVLIAFGCLIIFGTGKNFRHRSYLRNSLTDDYIDDVAVFSGVERNINSPSFRGGKVVTIFGGAKLNLNQATLSPDLNVLEVVCLFGGTTLLIPADWNVKVEVMHIFGGFVDKRPPIQVDQNKTLIIKGVTMFGGGEVKSY